MNSSAKLRLGVLAMSALFSAAMLGCDPNQVGNQTQSAARGTRDAVRATKTGIEKAQDEASKAADEITGGKKPEAPKPADDGRPKPAPKPALPPSSPVNP